MRASIIIRTLNEARHLGELLDAVARQELPDTAVEVIVVDSGSTDRTLEIARRSGCMVRHIPCEKFSFGRSLNMGCEAAQGEFLVFISGHCVPTGPDWLAALLAPLRENLAEYTYGRQVGGPKSHFSECRIFSKYYPPRSESSISGYFCNNANAALRRNTWARHQFDEELTGLEDMDLAKRLVAEGGRVRYVPQACVVHYHNETWRQVQRRFEREALALRSIMPHLHLTRWDITFYLVTSIFLDISAACRAPGVLHHLPGILRYRFSQYIGSYCGNQVHKQLSNAEKQAFFYPK